MANNPFLNLPLDDRKLVMQYLVDIAGADSVICDHEQSVLTEIRDELEIPKRTVTLNRAYSLNPDEVQQIFDLTAGPANRPLMDWLFSAAIKVSRADLEIQQNEKVMLMRLASHLIEAHRKHPAKEVQLIQVDDTIKNMVIDTAILCRKKTPAGKNQKMTKQAKLWIPSVLRLLCHGCRMARNAM